MLPRPCSGHTHPEAKTNIRRIFIEKQTTSARLYGVNILDMGEYMSGLFYPCHWLVVYLTFFLFERRLRGLGARIWLLGSPTRRAYSIHIQLTSTALYMDSRSPMMKGTYVGEPLWSHLASAQAKSHSVRDTLLQP